MVAHARAGALAAAALLLTGVLAGCEDGTDDKPGERADGGTTSSSASQRLAWNRCEAPEGGEQPGSEWRCATVKVPLDYAKPEGDTIGIALIRKEATDTSKRLGSMLFDFGGPGGSGVSILPRAAAGYATLNSRYDLVGFDPRGVAQSAGVRCRDDKAQEKAFQSVDMTPDTAAEEAAFMADGADFGAGCARLSGKVLPYVGTTNAARDMDVIRQALGDEKLTYFGMSYGTELGGTYAHLFPENVGRTVLDAVVDPTADTTGHARNQATGFQRALENYLKDRGQDPKAGARRIAALLKRIDAEPLPTGTDRELNESLAITGIVTPSTPRTAGPPSPVPWTRRRTAAAPCCSSSPTRTTAGTRTATTTPRTTRSGPSPARTERRGPRRPRRKRCCRSSRSCPRSSARSWPGTRRAGAPAGRWKASTTTRRRALRVPVRSWSWARRATRPRRTRALAGWRTSWARASACCSPTRARGTALTAATAA